ncbi:MAG TPA: amidohydrolase family protein [Acidobacteriaceae bacterium]
MRGWAAMAVTAALAASTGCAHHHDERAGPRIDPGIAQLIDSIWAVDNHAHPVLAPPQDATDREFDALPVDSLEPESEPPAYRPDFPEQQDAWKALWGFDEKPPLDAVGLQRLNAARARIKQREGENFTAWVLDQAHIGTQVGNRVAMGFGVEPPRFRWVPYDDALLFPLDNSGLAAETPDRKKFFPLEDKVRARYLTESSVKALPDSLDTYLAKVVTPTLERQKAGGAVAVKFEVAYLRGFDFGNPPQEQAAKIYAEYAAHGIPSDADYKTLQDFLFRYFARECGRLGMAVHLHAMAGDGSYFGVAGVNPLLLEPLFNDPRLRKTNFVLLHGGWPYEREVGALLEKPNVYADLSSQDLLMTPHTQAQWLREWLEWEPEKVLFGTDGYPYSDQMGWAESTWIANRNGREALGLALTGMLRDGEISRERAEQMARLVLRGNAERLYGFQGAK